MERLLILLFILSRAVWPSSGQAQIYVCYIFTNDPCPIWQTLPIPYYPKLSTCMQDSCFHMPKFFVYAVSNFFDGFWKHKTEWIDTGIHPRSYDNVQMVSRMHDATSETARYNDRDGYFGVRTKTMSTTECIVESNGRCYECVSSITPLFINDSRQPSTCSDPLVIHINPQIDDKSTPTCSNGTFQVQEKDTQCDGKCMANCLSCSSDKVCQLCKEGTLASPDSSACSLVSDTCPTMYFPKFGRCTKCYASKECIACDKGSGVCTQCSASHLLALDLSYAKCAPLCPMGFFYDARASTCARCPPYCARCDASHNCLECTPGYYERLQPTGTVACHLTCPAGTFGTTAYPLQCLPCHPACWECRGGGSAFHCVTCKSFGVLELETRAIRCVAKSAPTFGKCPYANGRVQLSVDTLRSLRKAVVEETGVETLLTTIEMACAKQLRGADNCGGGETCVSVLLLFSRYETDTTTMTTVNGTPSARLPLRSLFYPKCVDDDCRENCVRGTLLDPCPACAASFYRTPAGKCVAHCPEHYLAHAETRACVQCPDFEECAECEWTQTNASAELDAPLRFGWRAISGSDVRTRAVCVRYANRTRRHECDARTEFRMSDGVCHPCHSECAGCTGFGANFCIKCNNFLDPDGYCVQRCPPMLIPRGVSRDRAICFYQPPVFDTQENIYPNSFFNVSGFQRSLLVPWAFATCLLITLILMLISAFTRSAAGDDNLTLICFKNEDVIAAQATELRRRVIALFTAQLKETFTQTPRILILSTSRHRSRKRPKRQAAKK